MKDLSSIKPTTIGGIKRLAKQMKKAELFPGESHIKLLDRAAVRAGYSNYTNAFNVLGGPENESKNTSS